ncbi:hypothetical protein F5Y19DRAFT_462581 [Xylariaceae sp. FL1651]|nr:hypothetical protein F5Y19DRAFT_462581 [Xylariaceae sp. FL1651]
MAVPFGFSVGDIITVGTLVHNIIRAIDERKGAAADYQSCVSTLRSLYSCINTIKDSLKFTQNASKLELHEIAFINGLMYEMNTCRDLLNVFLKSTFKYTASFLPISEARKLEEAQTVIPLFREGRTSMKRLDKIWKKVSWAAFWDEDVRKLERDLQGHLSALQLYETFLQQFSINRVEKSTAETVLVTHNIEVTMMTILDLLKSVRTTLPPQMSDKIHNCQPIFFEDALGRSIELPREFCVSKERFQQHLEILFQGMPGHDKVVKKEYHLEDPTGITIMSTKDWHLQVRAGTKMAMTLLFQLVGRTKDSIAKICPRCETMNRPNQKQGMTQCFNCKLVFEIVHTKHVAELRDDTRHHPFRVFDALSDGLWSQQQERSKSMKQDAFRRIRYFNETPFYKYRCKYFYRHDCPSWVYVNNTSCAICSVI